MKSVYSVILRDELVKRLDAVAYESGVSRSVMLNKILADYLGVETPDTIIENVFAYMEGLFSNAVGMRFINQASSSMASVTSALEYRYNPKLKYTLELFPAGDLGQLKISLRSQNPALIGLLEDFYSFFISLESRYIGERTYFYQDLRFIRVFKRPSSQTAEDIANEISNYVKAFDKYLNIYFSALSNLPVAKSKIEADYRYQIAKKEFLL